MNIAQKSLAWVLAVAQVAAWAQSSQEQQAAHYERLRREREADEQRRQEAQREREFRDMLEQRERDKARNGSGASQGSSSSPRAEADSGPGLGTAVGAAALLIGGAYLLEQWLSDDKPAPKAAQPVRPPRPLPALSGRIFEAQDVSLATERNRDANSAGESPQLLYVHHTPAFDPRGQGIAHAEYHPTGHVLLVHRDGRRFDLGQRVQREDLHRDVRRAGYVTFMQTRDREIVTLQVLSLRHVY